MANANFLRRDEYTRH